LSPIEGLLAWLAHYGYPGLFLLLMFGILGLPIPEETLLVFCGYLIFRGRLRFAGAFAAGFAGSLCGISMSYLLGRRFGLRLIHRYGKYIRVTPENVHRVSGWFRRIGAWLLTIGYFVPGMRHFTALVAGMAHLRYGTFAAFAYPGAAIWVALFLSLGYGFGERWEHTSAMVHRFTLIAAGVIAAILAIIGLIRRRRESGP